jgi:hypothetical protein
VPIRAAFRKTANIAVCLSGIDRFCLLRNTLSLSALQLEVDVFRVRKADILFTILQNC